MRSLLCKCSRLKWFTAMQNSTGFLCPIRTSRGLYWELGPSLGSHLAQLAFPHQKNSPFLILIILTSLRPLGVHFHESETSTGLWQSWLTGCCHNFSVWWMNHSLCSSSMTRCETKLCSTNSISLTEEKKMTIYVVHKGWHKCLGFANCKPNTEPIEENWLGNEVGPHPSIPKIQLWHVHDAHQ